MTGKFRGAGAHDVLPGMRPLEIFNLNLDGRQELAGIAVPARVYKYQQLRLKHKLKMHVFN